MRISANDPRVPRCGFARLVGEGGLDYILRKYECTMGRRSKAANQDVVLGDVMSISRNHAEIKWSFDTQCWELHILGKNGVTVDGTLYTPEHSPVELQSQSMLQIGDRTFYFLLPKDLSRARRKKPKWVLRKRVCGRAAKHGRSLFLAVWQLLPLMACKLRNASPADALVCFGSPWRILTCSCCLLAPTTMAWEHGNVAMHC